MSVFDKLPKQLADKIMPCPITGCWLWSAYVGKNGYGYVNFNRTPTLAHRLVKSIIDGPLADGMECDHLCRVRSCVNPAHIEEVTSAENTRRGDAGKRNREKTHCNRGHLLSGENLYLYSRGARGCRECMSEAGRRRYAANPDLFKMRAFEQRQRNKAIKNATR